MSARTLHMSGRADEIAGMIHFLSVRKLVFLGMIPTVEATIDDQIKWLFELDGMIVRKHLDLEQSRKEGVQHWIDHDLESLRRLRETRQRNEESNKRESNILKDYKYMVLSFDEEIVKLTKEFHEEVTRETLRREEEE